MSLGDYLRYLRALRGGPTPWEIAQEVGLDSPRLLSEIEQRYRKIGDDETLEKLAAYYDVPLEELHWRRERSRKAFTAFANEAMLNRRTVLLHLRLGQTLRGRILWWDLGAIGLDPLDGSPEMVVQRHAIDDWEVEAGDGG